MATETTYTKARAEFARLLARAGDDREVVVVRRRGHAPVALVAADELSSLMETAHLLRSPANARRLLSALRSALGRKGRPETPASLRRKLGLGASD
jgi:antitoxin YefM